MHLIKNEKKHADALSYNKKSGIRTQKWIFVGMDKTTFKDLKTE